MLELKSSYTLFSYHRYPSCNRSLPLAASLMLTPKNLTKLQAVLTKAHFDFEKGLNRHALLKVSNQALGEDLVQDAFLKTWKYLVKGGKVLTMKAFLYHVLNNLIIDQYRKPKTTSLDALLEKNFDPGTDLSENLFNKIDGGNAALLIKLLPGAYRKVMHMRFIELLSIKEMSKITRKSPNAISVIIFRGLKKLKALYKDQIT